MRDEIIAHGWQIRDELRRGVGHGLHHLCGGIILDWLAGGVDFGHDNLVGVVEGVGELVEQGTRARVGVRLPNGPDAASGVTGTGRGQRCADLGWMMGVVVNDDDPVRFAADLEPASRTRKLAQGLGAVFQRKAEQAGHGQRGQRVEDIVAAGNL